MVLDQLAQRRFHGGLLCCCASSIHRFGQQRVINIDIRPHGDLGVYIQDEMYTSVMALANRRFSALTGAQQNFADLR
jgi:hypothetical protein